MQKVTELQMTSAQPSVIHYQMTSHGS